MAGSPLLTFLLVYISVSGTDSECLTCTGECRDTKVDITFVVDGSGSICENAGQNCNNWKNILQFVNNVVDHLNIGNDNDRVAFVQFANDAKIEFPLSTYRTKESAKQAILNINHRGGNTNMSGGIRVMRQKIFFTAADRLAVKNMAVVITDGISTRDPDLTIPEAEAARNAGIKIYSIGITPSVDETEIQKISSLPQTINISYWLLSTFSEASGYDITEHMFNTVCQDEPKAPAGATSVISRCPGKTIGDDCYVIQETQASWSTAEGDCSTLASVIGLPGGGQLAMPKTQQLMSQLKLYLEQFRAGKSFIEQEKVTSFWLGGHEEAARFGNPGYPVWRWLKGLATFTDQGCFRDESGSPDVGSPSTIAVLTPQKCQQLCHSYKYAATQAGNLCSCGDTYGAYGATGGCNTPCEGNSSLNCGGRDKNRILLNGGAYAEWGPDQPSHYDNYQPCASLELNTGHWQLNDRGPYQKFSYICALPQYICYQTSERIYQMVDNVCLHFVATPKSWFKARESCMAENGDLVSADSRALHAGIVNTLNNILFMYSPFWVGATARLWTWKDGEAITYTAWSPDEPNEASKNCLMVQADALDRFWWRDEACDTFLPSVCHIDLSGQIVQRPSSSTPPPPPPTTSRVVLNSIRPTSTPTIPTILQTTIVNTNQTSGNSSEPDFGASRVAQNAVSSVFYTLIVFAILLIFFVAVALFILKAHIDRNKWSIKKGSNYITPEEGEVKS